MRYLFGAYSLDTQLYELRQAGEALHLGPQVFNVLAYLLAHRDRVVSRDELFEQLWPGQYVTDDALGRCIRALRRVLGDDSRTPTYIATVRRRGYRFIAPVQEQSLEPPDVEDLATPFSQPTLLPSATDLEARQQPESLVAAEEDNPPSPERAPSPAYSGEYKQVTVCAGVVASASDLAARLGPERMHDLMQMMYAALQQIMHQYEGVLIEFSGDGFLGLFGAPVAQEDHAQRAVLAALALHDRLRETCKEQGLLAGETPALCLGLHTGRVLVDWLGDDPQRLYTAAGETTEVALQLRQLAAPGSVLISEATQRLAHESARCEPHGGIEIGNAHLAMPVYSVREITRLRSGVMGHGARARTPFVGRQRELALLHERLDAAQAGHGQVVGLVGEPGMGKSRLLVEFRRGLAGKPVRYSEGHCLAFGGATPYLPVLDLVREVCGITQADRRDAITAKVHQRLQEAEIVSAEAAPLVLQLLDIAVETGALTTLSASARKARTFAFLRQLFLHESQQQPCVIVIENLHWIDATSEEWLTSLVERFVGVPMMLLTTYRPGYRPPWSTPSYATQIALPQLWPDESRALVLSAPRSASLPEALVHDILAKAEGNPFFLEELVLHVLEQGIEHPPLRVPETLQAVLAARIDRLTPEAKRVLQTAAVIGMRIGFSLLQTVVGDSEEELHKQLDALRTAELLYETASLSDGSYTFKHALSQEVAYESLLRSARQSYHRRIAEVLEVQFPETAETRPELLAHHYAEGGLLQQAVVYGRRAGEEARKRFARVEAVAYLTTALERLACLPDTPERGRQELKAQLTLAHVLTGLKGYAAPETARAYARARDLCEQMGETSTPYLVALRGLFRAYNIGGDLPRTGEVSETFMRLAQAQDDPAPVLAAHRGLGDFLFCRGEFFRARQHLEQSLVGAERIPTYQLSQFGVAPEPGLGLLAETLWMLGYVDQALEKSKEALTLASNALTLANALQSAGMVRLLRREPKSAWELSDEMVVLTTEHGLSQQLARGLMARGIAWSRQGHREEGLAQIVDGVTAYRATGAGTRLTWFLGWLAEAYGCAGHFEEAQLTLMEAMGRIAKWGECCFEVELRRLQGEMLLQQTMPDERQAESCFQQAMSIAQQQNAKSWELRAATSLARLWQSWNRRQDAYDLLSPVYESFTEGFDTADLIDAKVLLNELVAGRA